MPQRHNSQLVEQLVTDFQRRKEPNFATANAYSTFISTPRLRGLWNSCADENESLIDMAHQNRTLARTGAGAVVNAKANTSSYIGTDGTDYFHRAAEAGLQITGNMTIWTWVYFFPPMTGVDDYFMGVFGIAGQRAYLFFKDPADKLQFLISTDGTNNTYVGEPLKISYAASKWMFMAARFTASTELALFIGDAFTGKYWWYRNAVGIPATIFSSAHDFEIGSGGYAGVRHNGATAWAGLAAYAVPDVDIWNKFQQTRAVFIM